MNIKRFMWVRPAGRGKLHIKYGNTSEGPVKCGSHARKGWWIVSRTNWKQVCLRCLAS